MKIFDDLQHYCVCALMTYILKCFRTARVQLSLCEIRTKRSSLDDWQWFTTLVILSKFVEQIRIIRTIHRQNAVVNVKIENINVSCMNLDV